MHMSVDFKSQISFGKDVEVHTWIEQVGTKSFTVSEELWQAGIKCAAGKAVYVNFDYTTQQSEPIQGDIRQKLEGLQADLN